MTNPTALRLSSSTMPRLNALRARLGGVFRSRVTVDGALTWLLEIGELELSRLEDLRLGGAAIPDPLDLVPGTTVDDRTIAVVDPQDRR
jgi:hypothetical protein